MNQRFICLSLLVVIFLCGASFGFSQNVGLSTTGPVGKFHIKGTEDKSQLIIDAYNGQTNTNPLIRIRESNGTNLLWINSDTSLNVFVGINAGRVNNKLDGGI